MINIQSKFENFKIFVKSISRNLEAGEEYENMSWWFLQSLAYVLLLPSRHELDVVTKGIQEKLDFDDEHLPKFERYLTMFCEYLAGEDISQEPPEYITSSNMTIEERKRLHDEEQEK